MAPTKGPPPVRDDDPVLLGHGSGGEMTARLIGSVILPSLFPDGNVPPQEDAAPLSVSGTDLVITTDSYIVDPFIFPGGTIGDLAVNGTINDIVMGGGVPAALTIGLILEEGLLAGDLRRVLRAAGETARSAVVPLLAGDTKVVPRGKGDKIFINTSGIGVRRPGVLVPSAKSIRPGDALIVSGTVGDHGVAILSAREGLSFAAPVVSDTAALHGLVDDLYAAGIEIHALRDPTRGGLATVAVEWAESAALSFTLDERSIPVAPAVAGACELLGLDPTLVANEGKLLAAVPLEQADAAVAVMRRHPLGRHAAIIGRASEGVAGRVTMTSLIGGHRIVHRLPGELLPRIC
ncbi:MAG: hydrogenase expression/formation protein HypE [Nitrospinae bacterium]|nr:hydrogenase expression/formation protein HypE [Nitrospinota bacterium]